MAENNFERGKDPKRSLKIGVLEESKELLERSLEFINWMKQDQGEFDDDGLEDDIINYLEKIDKD